MNKENFSVKYIRYYILKHRMLILLFSILILLASFPFFYAYFPEHIVIMEIGFSLLLIINIYLVDHERKVVTVTSLLVLLDFVLVFFNFILINKNILIFDLLLKVLCLGITTAMILNHVVQERKVGTDKICGAINAYLLIGTLYALIYTTIEICFQGSFVFNQKHTIDSLTLPLHHYYFSQFMYYSYITLTTLGFGDIVPHSSLARVITSLEAISGQLYITVLIARLVSLHIAHTKLTTDSSKQ